MRIFRKINRSENIVISLHGQLRLNDGKLYLITAYIPGVDKWERDLKTRKEKSK